MENENCIGPPFYYLTAPQIDAMVNRKIKEDRNRIETEILWLLNSDHKLILDITMITDSLYESNCSWRRKMKDEDKHDK